MSHKFKDNCWADKINADFEYLGDIELNQFLVFDLKQGCLRIYQDSDQKSSRFVKVQHLPSKIDALLAHPQMTKKQFPYLIVQADKKVSVIRSNGIQYPTSEPP
jgi:hypothetical protein